MNILFDIKTRIRYTLKAHHRKGFGIHSPYIFSLLNDTIFEKHPYYIYPQIEQTRRKLIHDHTTLHIHPIGTSTRTTTTIHREATISTKPAKYAQLIHRLALHNKAHTIIELGTNLGLTTLYLAATSPKAHIYTIEGQPAIAQIAQQNFTRHHAANITLIQGTIEDNLTNLLNQIPQIDLLYIDANHRYQPTIQYYTQAKTKITPDTIFIIDDPHWSPQMEKAWKQITADPQATITLDLFQIGIVIFKPEIPKQHYTIRF